MASDHRGRALHAGKRTAQELGWRAQAYQGDPQETVYTKGRTDTGLVGMVVSPVHPESENPGTYNWQVHTDDGGPTSPLSDLGRGKKTMVATSNPGTVRMTIGEASTPTRAIIAAEAMKKRIDEGRDLKTGRPKK